MPESRSLEEIKVEMDLLCLDIENLQDGDKIAAVKHIEDSLGVIKIGSSLAFQLQSPAKRAKVEIVEAQPTQMKTEPEASEVQRKFQNLYNGLVPTCDQCGATFPTLTTLDTHITRNHQTNKAAKTEVKKETKENTRLSMTKKDEKKLSRSKSTKPADKRYQCEFCDKDFGKKRHVERHAVGHTSKFKCERCKHRFAEERKLRKHLLNKENCQKYLGKNDEMADISSIKTETKVEKKIVKETEGFKCVPCDVSFSKQYNLSRHERRESHKLKTNRPDISLIEA